MIERLLWQQTTSNILHLCSLPEPERVRHFYPAAAHLFCHSSPSASAANCTVLCGISQPRGKVFLFCFFFFLPQCYPENVLHTCVCVAFLLLRYSIKGTARETQPPFRAKQASQSRDVYVENNVSFLIRSLYSSPTGPKYSGPPTCESAAAHPIPCFAIKCCQTPKTSPP